MLQLRIEAIKWETADIATFYLKDTESKRVSYQAGQFITLVFKHRDQEIRRSYSLSSSPAEELLAITIKRIANGEISRYMLSKLKVGDILTAVEPAGRFTFKKPQSKGDLFLFAAGTGITPNYSLIKDRLSKAGQTKLTLFYSSNNEKILFRPRLDELAAKYPEFFTIVYLISSEGQRLNNLQIERLIKQYLNFKLEDAEFFLCGPFSYTRMVRLTLLYMRIDANKIRSEKFVIDTIKVPNTLVNYPPGFVKINFKGERFDIATGENQTILQAALQNGIQLPYSCRVGSCSTCAAVCKSGKVLMSANEVLTDDDINQGFILTCTGHVIGEGVEIAFS